MSREKRKRIGRMKARGKKRRLQRLRGRIKEAIRPHELAGLALAASVFMHAAGALLVELGVLVRVKPHRVAILWLCLRLHWSCLGRRKPGRYVRRRAQ